jgi:hypothetical protein
MRGYQLINNTIPLVNDTIIRGYKIPTNEIRNQVIIRNFDNVGDLYTYEVFFPFLIRWEKYRELLINNVPSELIDANEPFNGLNFFLHRYDLIADWGVYYRLQFYCVENDLEFRQNFDTQLNTVNYEAHTKVVSREVKTFSENGATELLIGSNNAVDLSQKTKIVAKWVMDFAPDPAETTVVFWSEQKNNGSPLNIDRISSINGLFEGSEFENEANDNKIQVTITGNEVEAVAFYNPDTTTQTNKTIYPVLYLPNMPDDALRFEDGELWYTEEGDLLYKE